MISEENKRIQEWLEKFNLFLDESLQGIHRIYPRRAHLEDKEDKVKWYGFRTQKIRRDIVRGLGELLDTALSFAKQDTLDLKEREKWGRLAAYIAQTINTIMDSYDTVEIERILDELKQFVKTNLEDGR